MLFHISFATVASISVPRSAHKFLLLLLCFLGEVQAKNEEKKKKKGIRSAKTYNFPGSSMQKHIGFFLRFSGKSITYVRQCQHSAAARGTLLPGAPGDRRELAMVTPRAAFRLLGCLWDRLLWPRAQGAGL